MSKNKSGWGLKNLYLVQGFSVSVSFLTLTIPFRNFQLLQLYHSSFTDSSTISCLYTPVTAGTVSAALTTVSLPRAHVRPGT